MSKPLSSVKFLIVLCLGWISFTQANAQQAIFPDTIISINADDYLSVFTWDDPNPLYEFSDGSIVLGVIGFDSSYIATTPNDTNYSHFMDYRDVTLYALDSNLQFKNAIAVINGNFIQVGDTLFGATTVFSGNVLDLNPAGTPVLVYGTNCSKSYLVAYDKDLQLIRSSEINCKGLAFATVRDVRGGKLFVGLNEKDSHPQGGQFGMGRQRLATYDMQFNPLTSVTVFSRQGTFWGFNLLSKFIPSVNGGYYGCFASGTIGHDYNIALNGQTPILRPSTSGNLGYLVKYDNSLNILWEAEVEMSPDQAAIRFFQDLFESPNGDSLILIAGGFSDGLYYHQGSNQDTIHRDTNTAGNDMILVLNAGNGELSSSYSTDMNNPTQNTPGGKVYREARSFQPSNGGPVQTEYLNFKNNTIQVPDSSSAVAIYDDISTGVPSSYRILGYMGSNHQSGLRYITPGPVTNRLYIAGFYRGNLSLDASSSYVLPDFNGETSVYLGVFGMGALVGKDAPQPGEFVLYPNPATDRINFEYGSERPERILLISLDGQVLASLSPETSDKVSISLDPYPAGIYFIEATYANGERIGKRFVKQ